MSEENGVTVNRTILERWILVAIISGISMVANAAVVQPVLIDYSSGALYSESSASGRTGSKAGAGQYSADYAAVLLVNRDGLPAGFDETSSRGTPSGNNWYTPSGTTAGTLVFDLGADGISDLAEFVLWSVDTTVAPKNFKLRFFTSAGVQVGAEYSGTATSTVTTPQRFEFSSPYMDVRYIEWEITSNYGSTSYISAGEICFVVAAAIPEISVLDEGSEIADGASGSNGSDYGLVDITGEVVERTYVITNSGSAVLNLTGTPLVSISGSAADEFTVVSQPGSAVEEGESVSFKIRFDPSSSGVREAEVLIANDDSDEGTYSFAIFGEGDALSQSISAFLPADGSTFTSADTARLAALASSGLSVGFSVQSGPGVITGGTNLSFSGAGTVVVAATQAGNSTYNAAETLMHTYTITPDDRGIAMLDEGEVVSDGSTGSACSYFGLLELSGATAERTYTVTNSGTATLTLTGDPAVSISGSARDDFTIFSQPASTVLPGACVSFTVQFDPSLTGPRSATLSITNNDADVRIYDFELYGVGVEDGVALEQTINEISPADGNVFTTTNTVELSGLASSRLPVTFSIWSGPGSITDGANLTFSAAGTVVVLAEQAGDSTWNAAPDVRLCFRVSKTGYENHTYSASYALSALDGLCGFRLDGVGETDYAGCSVSDAGDVNGDGFDDVIIGAESARDDANYPVGESYLVFGKALGWDASLALSDLDGTNGVRVIGIGPSDRTGCSVSTAGDINGDGYGDVIIGARTADPTGGNDAGESYVVFGKADGWPSVLELSSLAGDDGFRIDGIDASDYSGWSVSGAGDVNGDGFDDVIIGAYGADTDAASDAGESYVVFGKAEGWDASIVLSALNGSNGFRLDGELASDFSGISVSGAGDVNGDGCDDMVVGAHCADFDGALYAGAAYVVFGKTSGWTASMNLAALDGASGFKINGVNGWLGRSVSGAGDVNGDGFDDVLIGAPDADPVGRLNNIGESYVLYGKATEWNPVVNPSLLDGDDGFRIVGVGADYHEYSGYSSSGAGDVNGDGYADVLIGAYGFNDLAGESYVVFGGIPEGTATVDLATLGGTNGFCLAGIDADDESGFSVSGAGDVNGDGYADVIVGAHKADPNGVDGAGESYVFFGGYKLEQTLTVEPDDAQSFVPGESVGLTATSSSELDVALEMLSGPGVFVDGMLTFTGLGTVVVQATQEGNTDYLPAPMITRYYRACRPGYAARSYNASYSLADLDGSNGFRINGIDADDYSGYSVNSAGDVNGDGYDDVIIGARWADVAGESTTYGTAGESYLVFGKAGGWSTSMELSTLDGTNGVCLAGAAQSGQAGFSVGGGGDVNGDGYDDVIIGAPYANKFYVVFGKANGWLASMDLAALDGTDGFCVTGNYVSPRYSENLGYSVSGAGDVNGDGCDDLIIGASAAYYSQTTYDAGQSYVVFGKSSGWSSAFSVSTLNGQNGFCFQGYDKEGYLGSSVSAAGDFNGDGFDDLIIGSSGWSGDWSSDDGAAFLVRGKATGWPSIFYRSSDDVSFLLAGGTDDELGYSVSAAGDVNADGYDDLIVGAPKCDASYEGAGQSYVVLGKPDGDPSGRILITGISTYDYSGWSVSGAGDVNADGYDDLIVGALYGDPGGADSAGESYVIFGADWPRSQADTVMTLGALVGSDGFRLDGIDAADQSGYSVSGAGDVNADGYDDLIIGAPYAHPGDRAKAGESYVVFGGGTVVGSPDQTLSEFLPAHGSKFLPVATARLSATASSGLDVTFSVLSGPGLISGGTNLSFTGSGWVRVVAVQLGTAAYDATRTTNTYNVLDISMGRQVDVSISGSGSVEPGSGLYIEDTDVDVSAIPAEGWLFMGWSGDLSGDYTASNTTLLVDSEKAITATFSDDADGDGLKNTNEWAIGSDARNSDTDGDGYSDGFEVTYGLSPVTDTRAFTTYIQNNPGEFGVGGGSTSATPAVVAVAPADESLVASSAISIDLTFSETVTGVDATDLVLSGASSGSAVVAAPVNLSSNLWRYRISGLAPGALSLSLAPDANDIEDADGDDLVTESWSYTVVTDLPAGSLDSPAAPASTNSAMHTLDDLYNRLDTGAAGSVRAFTEPTFGPSARTMHSLNEIMAEMPAQSTNAAAPSNVDAGKWYWGLQDGQWGPKQGTGVVR